MCLPRGRSANDLLLPLLLTLGMDVDLSTFTKGGVLGFALILTLAAILGKLISGLGVAQKGKHRVNRWIVGLGMIPRGEVGLIFAGIGLSLTLKGESVVPGPDVYAAVVIMVILTTLVTPPVLTWSFSKYQGPT